MKNIKNLKILGILDRFVVAIATVVMIWFFYKISIITVEHYMVLPKEDFFLHLPNYVRYGKGVAMALSAVLSNSLIGIGSLLCALHLYRINNNRNDANDKVAIVFVAIEFALITLALNRFVLAFDMYIPRWAGAVVFTQSIAALIILALTYLGYKWRSTLRTMPSRIELTEMAKTMNSVAKARKFGVWAWNIKTGKIVWSDGLYSIYEKPRDWTIDLAVLDSYVAEEEMEAYLEHRNTTEESQFIYRITIDGRSKYIEAHSIPVTNDKGEIISMHGYVQDVTSMKAIEREKDLQIIELKSEVAHLKTIERSQLALERLKQK